MLYWPAFLPPDEADELLVQLKGEIAWEQQELTIFGRRVKAPRLSAWYGDEGASYAYSGLQLTPLGWTPGLQRVKTRLQEALQCAFNSVLANLYRDGSDSMGWHSDDEPELGAEPLIASVSLGAGRRFILKHKKRADLKAAELVPQHGSLIVMQGCTQTHWRHGIPKTRATVGERLNLTFRQIAL